MAISTLRRGAFLGLLLAVALALMLTVLFAIQPRQAVASHGSSPCSTWWTLPSTGKIEGWVVADGGFNCPTSTGRNTSSIKTTIQERWGWWRSRATTPNWGCCRWVLASTAYYCEGHGTDSWRTKVKGYDNFGDYKIGYSPAVSLTC